MSLDFTISLCLTCKHKKICKHYKYFRDNEDIGVLIKDCDNFEDKNVHQSRTKISTGFNPVSQIQHNNVPLSQDSNKLYPDLKLAENKMHTINKVEPVSISKVVCDRCKQEVLATDIDNCVECGRAVCKDCGVGALENGKLLFTCEKCWSGSPDPDPNKVEDVVITYGEEKNEWDMEDFKEESLSKSSKEKENKKDVRTKKTNNK